jgi:hypothetical protein
MISSHEPSDLIAAISSGVRNFSATALSQSSGISLDAVPVARPRKTLAKTWSNLSSSPSSFTYTARER